MRHMDNFCELERFLGGLKEPQATEARDTNACPNNPRLSWGCRCRGIGTVLQVGTPPCQVSDIKLHLCQRGQRSTKSCHLPLGTSPRCGLQTTWARATSVCLRLDVPHCVCVCWYFASWFRACGDQQQQGMDEAGGRGLEHLLAASF